MNNLFAQSRSHWVRYDCYEIKTGKDGKRYITPTRFPQGQNERKANFGTSVESCSKKLPDCRSLATATFSGNL